MLLGFISLLLTASSRTIASICIDSKFYNKFSPCSKSEIEDTSDAENGSSQGSKQLLGSALRHSFKRILTKLHPETCAEGHEPFVSYGGLEQLHRFIFVMAITHVSYSCLTMLLAIVKIHTWRKWEEEAHRDRHDSYAGSNLYFWIAIIPIALVLLVGAKLQHVIATLALESVGVSGLFTGPKLKPRDDLFWFKKPELLLYLIHFILFQNAFELASFFWFWWQFGYYSCFIRNHQIVYVRLILGFAGQFLCSYSTLPLYALVTQMGSNYKAALIPHRIRETMHGWGKAARKRRKHRRSTDDSTTIRTETSTVCSLEEGDQELFDNPSENPYILIELQTTTAPTTAATTPLISEHTVLGNGTSNCTCSHVPLLQSSVSVPSSPSLSAWGNRISRSYSMPAWRG